MMSEEREQARVVSAYTDALVTRRRDGMPSLVPETEGGLEEILDLSREVSTIRIVTPSTLHDRMWRSMTADDLAKPADSMTTVFRWLRLSRLQAVPALTVVLAVFGWWVALQVRDSQVSAAELLKTSSAGEASRVSQRGVIAHRTFAVETRSLPPGDARVMRQRVELWADAKTRTRARRLFDEEHRLVAGEWTNADGSRVVYESREKARHESAAHARPLTIDTIWRWDASADHFATLAAEVDRSRANSTLCGRQRE